MAAHAVTGEPVSDYGLAKTGKYSERWNPWCCFASKEQRAAAG
jgi:hypothetical protein